MKRTVGVGLTIAILLFTLGALPLQAQTSPPLQFFKNYFLTGDYAVGGTSLWRRGVNGRAAGSIVVSGVPEGANIVAAYLYVQTTEVVQWSGIDNAKFAGVDLGPGAQSLAKALNWEAATTPCWSLAFPGQRRLVTYRADVLRFLPIGADGKQAANGAHAIDVPDTGASYSDDDEVGFEGDGTGAGARAIGSSLVVVYRDATKPLRAVEIFDGGATKRAFASFGQGLLGFYDAADVPAARMTHIVGDGRPYLSESVRFNGQVVATNPFKSSAGAKWDNPTFEGLPLPAGASSALVEVRPGGLLPDCLCYSAIVFSTAVRDTDADGLLDAWESQTTTNPASLLNDPYGRPLPVLGDMGADPAHKDLFVEVGYMFTEGPTTTYGSVEKPQHSHLPSKEALELVGRAFKNAPVANPDGTTGINVHFDVGANYQPAGGVPSDGICSSAATWTVDCAIVPVPHARGGDAIDEAVTVCTPSPTSPSASTDCQFSEYPGTVGWKTGFRFLRDEVLVGPDPLPGQEDPCDAPGSTCQRRFDPVRRDMFHYALFAHAIGLPKSEEPDSADFKVPRTNTGVGDFPGGDLMVTLGAFDDGAGNPVGTPFMQASTLMHELGHNFERRHGGDAFEPNCKPVYLSVMNYMYQLRGLLDDGGKPNLDFARGSVAPLDETTLLDGPLTFSSPHRIGWYAPLVGSYLESFGTAAAKHCDGTPLNAGEVMVRIDARMAADAIDWRADGEVDQSGGVIQDINFNGRTTRTDGAAEVLGGSDDWGKILLNQVGGRRTVGGLFVDAEGRPTVGPLSMDAGRGDLGRGDLGRGDLGRGDLGRGDLGSELGRGDLGRGDLGRGDLGRGDLGTVMGRGDLGRGDLGGGDLFVGDPDNPGGELDFETATELAKTPPTEFTACVIGVDCPPLPEPLPEPLHGARLAWKMPTIGEVEEYQVFRVDGPELTPAAMLHKVPVGVVSAADENYFLVDTSTLVNGAQYTYFTIAHYVDGTTSDLSNAVTITAVNDPPVANADAYSVDEDGVLNVSAPGVLGNDEDPDGALAATAAVVSEPSHGVLVLQPAGSFSYKPQANYFGTDTFTYRVADESGAGSEATVTITVNAVNDPPTAAGQNVGVIEDTATAIALVGNDVEGEPLTFAVVGPPTHGSLAPVSGGFVYTPAPNYVGTDAFTFTASDGTAVSNVATVVITVTPVNDPPVASGDAYSGVEDTPLVVAAPGVLGNDVDVDASPLEAVLVAGPSNGTFTLSANGAFSYAPPANFNGVVTFTYRVSDGVVSTAPVTVSLTIASVNDAPSGTNKTVLTRKNTAYVFKAADFGFADAADVPANTLLSVKIGSLPSGNVGSVRLNGIPVVANAFVTVADINAGRLKFIPKNYATGTTAFTFFVRDNGGTERGGIDVAKSAATMTTKVVSCSYSDDNHEGHGHR